MGKIYILEELKDKDSIVRLIILLIRNAGTEFADKLVREAYAANKFANIQQYIARMMSQDLLRFNDQGQLTLIGR